MWLFGIVLWEIMHDCLEKPFNGFNQTPANVYARLEEVMVANEKPIPLVWDARIPDEIIHLVNLCCRFVSTSRPSISFLGEKLEQIKQKEIKRYSALTISSLVVHGFWILLYCTFLIKKDCTCVKFLNDKALCYPNVCV